MGKNSLGWTLAKGLFYAFAAVILIYGVIREYDFMQYIAPGNVLLQVFGCVVFTGSMLVWMAVFFKGSRGLGQHALALLSSVVGMAFTIGASAASIWMRQMLTARPGELGDMAVWLVVAATGYNIFAVWLFHVLDPNIMRDIQEHVREALILKKADDKADALADAMSDELAGQIAAYRAANLRGAIESSAMGKRNESPADGKSGKPQATPEENGDRNAVMARLAELLGAPKTENGNGNSPKS